MIRIARWAELYEVNEKGAAWREGQAKRRGHLDYIRLRVNGAGWSQGYREFLAVAKPKKAAMAFGVFCKLLEVAGDQCSDDRGVIRNRLGGPATATDVAKMTGFSGGNVEEALNILSSPSVGWVEHDGASAPGTAAEKDAETAKSQDKLLDHPLLAGFWPHLVKYIKGAHPKARLPETGSKEEHEARDTLAKLARVGEPGGKPGDGYLEQDIISCLTWVFAATDRQAEFWRQQVQSVGALRQKKKGSTLSKYGKIHEQWLDRVRSKETRDYACRNEHQGNDNPFAD